MIDAAGKYVLPGAIDSHVHFRSPGYDYKEDWQTGTGAAARGGVTTVLEMPNTRPPTGTVAALKLKQDIAARQAYVDYGIYGLLDENNLGELDALIAEWDKPETEVGRDTVVTQIEPPEPAVVSLAREVALARFLYLIRRSFRCNLADLATTMAQLAELVAAVQDLDDRRDRPSVDEPVAMEPAGNGAGR